MAPPSHASRHKDWGRLGVEAAEAGAFDMARIYLEKAVRREKRHAGHRYNLAIVMEALGEIDAAARLLTEALRLKPAMAEAARRLERVLRAYRLEAPERLDPFGLMAALASDVLDRQVVGEVALAHLAATPPLRDALALGRREGWRRAAETLLARRTAPALRAPLLLAALREGVNRDPELERLLAAARRALLLDLEADRFSDKALIAFACALIEQCANNGHVWPASGEETDALDALAVVPSALAAGDGDASRALLQLALYRPLSRILPPDTDERALGGVRPKALAELVLGQLAAEREERRIGEAIPGLRPLTDETSRRVARQYEAAPYPRWRSISRPRPGSLTRALARFFSAETLARLTREAGIDILIAGAGTGHHAVLTALGHGAPARVLALDLSRRSLAYGARMSRAMGIENISFMQGDILDIGRLERQFDIIESVGVLHHMADPLEGWRRLVECLKPGGLMLIGLYSAHARASLAALRGMPDHPGPDCSDEEARAYRARLMERGEGEPGGDLVRSADFYTLADFRDLALHPCEQHFTLPEIAAFLDEAGLAFRGFTVPEPVWADFESRFPSDPWPGQLSHWEAMERARPRLFEGMYQLWCEKVR